MIIKDEEATKRLNSPMNLINRLDKLSNNSRKSAMSLFGLSQAKPVIQQTNNKIEVKSSNVNELPEVKVKSFNPFINKPQSTPPTTTAPEIPIQEHLNLDTILKNSDSQIKLGLAHDKSLDLLTRSVDILSAKLDDVKADKLPMVIASASKVVESIRRERNEAAKNSKGNEVHYHFYTPQQKIVEDYEVIDVGFIEDKTEQAAAS